MIAQTIFISIGTNIIAGAAGALAMATSLAILKPKTWGDGGRYVYYIDIRIFLTSL